MVLLSVEPKAASKSVGEREVPRLLLRRSPPAASNQPGTHTRRGASRPALHNIAGQKIVWNRAMSLPITFRSAGHHCSNIVGSSGNPAPAHVPRAAPVVPGVLSAPPGSAVPGSMPQKAVAVLRRAVPVEAVDAGSGAPPFQDRSRQRFARAHARAYRREVRGNTVVDRSQHVRVRCWNAEEQRRTMFAHNIEYRRRHRTSREQHRGGADVKRKILRVAEAVGEEEFGDAEAAVAGPDVEDRLSVRLAADPHVVLQMNDAFGLAGRSTRIKEERHRIAMRFRVFHLR